MIDHLSLPVSDYAKSKAFYVAALQPLGYTLMMEFGDHGGLGANGKPDLWIGKKDSVTTTHVAFSAKDRATVDAFYAAAMAAGAKDNGKPGTREMYHPNYYGAFVLDPDGHNIEAVCHDPA